MAKRICVLLVVSFFLFISTLIIYAQDEQWLQYHSAREVNLVGFRSNMKMLRVGDVSPADVNLPKFTGENQVFTQWMTPMVENGFLWVALDRSHKYGMYDILYIDSNGNGHLDDEEPIRQYRMDQSSSYFGPVKVVFDIEDGPVSYHLNFRYYGYNDEKRLYVSAGGWYQGEVTVEGKDYQCVLFDYNVNGAFSDKDLMSERSDRIRISTSNDAQDTRFVGTYIEINNKLYEPEIAPDGAYIKINEAQDVKYGTVKLSESVTELSAGGINGSFTVKPENGIGTLPIGKYQIENWTIRRDDDKGSRWELKGSQNELKGFFDVNEDFETALVEVGEPVITTVTASYRDGSYSFNQQIKGRDGEGISLMRNGSRPQAPQLNIKNKDGTYDRTYSFSYGWGSTCSLTWREPSNVKGPFTATINIGSPFEVESKPYVLADKKLVVADEASKPAQSQPVQTQPSQSEPEVSAQEVPTIANETSDTTDTQKKNLLPTIVVLSIVIAGVSIVSISKRAA